MATAQHTKKALLAAACEAALNAHPYGTVKVATRYRRQTERRTSRRDRVALMGDPCFYLEVLRSGPFESTVDVNGGASLQGIDRFQVSLFFAFSDHNDYSKSSQKKFEKLCYAEGDTPGLLVKLRDTTIVGTGDERCVLYQPENDVEDVVPLDDAATEAAHLLTFSIGIEG